MITFDAIKSAYRQTKEGYTVTFVIHPQDSHEELMAAPIGSQWNLKLVPLDENGNAPDAGEDKAPAAAREYDASAAREAGGAQQGTLPAAAPASRLTKQAAIACNDPVFRRFLRDQGMSLVGISEEAAIAVRLICHVQSRKEFIPGTPAGDRWQDLYAKFSTWRDVPEAAE
jgi:hypothetical protein